MDEGLHEVVDRVGELVMAKLGSNPAVQRLLMEAKSGGVSERTGLQVQVVLDDAVEQDVAFAKQLAIEVSKAKRISLEMRRTLDFTKRSRRDRPNLSREREVIEYIHGLVGREISFHLHDLLKEVATLRERIGTQAERINDLTALIAKLGLKSGLNSLQNRVTDLEEWRLIEESAETFGLSRSGNEPKSAVPVRYYIETDDRSVADDIERALVLILDEIGFRVAATYPPVQGSWFGRFFFISRDRLTPEQVAESLAKIERSVGVRTLDLPQSQVDQNRADGVAKLLTALENTPSALVQIGSILIIKMDGTPIVINLTSRELSELEREPAVFRSPSDALGVIQKLRQQDQAPATTRAISQGTSPAV
jgi:hypothetical protein